MRHENAELLLRIAMEMQGQAAGVGLKDIQALSDPPMSRRTAERCRDAVLRLFDGRHQEWVDDSGLKRWKIRTGLIRALSAVRADDLASLEVARKSLMQAGLTAHADNLNRIAALLTSAAPNDSASELAEALLATTVAEGIAVRPGPRVKVDAEVLGTIRSALRQRRVLRVQYRYRKSGIRRSYLLHPYGLVYGQRHYLLAGRAPEAEPRYFVLGGIESAVVEPHSAIQPKGFSLTRYLERSFGIWQEEPFDVHWHFAPEAAKDAADYDFHPTQQLDWDTDGSLHVRFRAGGCLEMAWHLATWGNAVNVVKPPDWEARLELAWEKRGG